jgi:hypothetical protein
MGLMDNDLAFGIWSFAFGVKGVGGFHEWDFVTYRQTDRQKSVIMQGGK